MNTFINPVSGRIHCHFTVIMSAWHTHGLDLGDAQARADLNNAYHKTLGLHLNTVMSEFYITECQGCYEGGCEDSYVVDCHDIVEVMQLVQLGRDFNQECILCIDHANDSASLIYMDGQVSRIGRRLAQACDTTKGDYTQIGSERYVVA